jgi:hypothetical protein
MVPRGEQTLVQFVAAARARFTRVAVGLLQPSFVATFALDAQPVD